ncbi:VOC family protein [Rhodanobacter sp. DHG33]|uniref:VOC family protein n=1 Tax=Rhodanobacter sp. DHG33 TaxID=2775921 RepID=UPI00177FCD1B|nr:VOC family protein [Rhodanobacter sp. DHG33]MBD8897912.1 VOC family protein [Rhodanobacter sp. DHG33]
MERDDIVTNNTALSIAPSDSATTSFAEAPYKRIDHIALAVHNLESAIHLFEKILGFELKGRRHIRGAHTGMISAEMEINGIRFVLCQGTEPQSQVAQLIENFGAGVAHIALEVDDVEKTVSALRGRGMQFDTKVIRGPGLTQSFTTRCGNTGLSFELIKREGEEGFLESNVQALFDQLEQGDKY